MAIQKEALELVAEFPGARRDVGPGAGRGAAARSTRGSSPSSRSSRSSTRRTTRRAPRVESRLWHAVFDLVKAFIAAYQRGAARPATRAPSNKRWRAILPWVLVRLAHYKGLDGKFRLFRYGHWIPAQWREFHELYEFARMRGWQREQLVLRRRRRSRKPGVSLEQEYLKTLLLMRLDSGNFTPDQVEWVARQLEDWAPSLTLRAAAGEPAPASSSTSRARRACAARQAARIGRPRAVPRRRPGLRAHRRADALAARAGRRHAAARRPAAARAAAAADAPRRRCSAPMRSRMRRAPRAFAAEGDVRVVVGLQALTRAVAEIERLPDARAHAGRRGELRRSHADGQPAAPIPDSVARRVRGTTWQMADRSDTRLPAGRAGQGRADASWARSIAIQGRRRLVARGRAADAAPAGRRGDRRRRDHRPAPRARAAAQLGDAARRRPRRAPSGRSSASTCRRIRTIGRRRSAA